MAKANESDPSFLTSPEFTTELEKVYDQNKIVEERREKLREIRAKGIAFPNDFDRKHYAQALQQAHGHKGNEDLNASPVAVAVAGRMMLSA